MIIADQGSIQARLTRRHMLAAVGAGMASACIRQTARATAQSRFRQLPDRIRGINFENATVQPLGGMIDLIKEWHVNTVRINIKVPRSKSAELCRGGSLLGTALEHDALPLIDPLVEGLDQAGISTILSGDQFEGRCDGPESSLTGDAYADLVTGRTQSLWDKVIRGGHLASRSSIDLLNEPHYAHSMIPGANDAWWKRMAPQLIDDVRRINAAVPIFVMPWPWGFPSGFKGLDRLADDKVIYAFHFYSPHTFTHQGVSKPFDLAQAVTYPGQIAEFANEPLVRWDKNQMYQSIRPALDFRDRHRVRMAVTEFGVTRWSPGADAWLNDAISIFEAEGLDWIFHSYGSWVGWNPSYAPDPKVSAPPYKLDGGYNSASHQVMMQAFRKNFAR
ncbi:glycoside hydrolase family 5 protein [Novosphingobium sediminicola]|uniref:Glycoside hydrolase family 5 domain-containing protein n=1 Tax=Novosphingobium sediminicola TaxID=563162 RepID=A0A7W6G685_9SPHN|nr:cellulase family glycosylhydrolase [Novosphingobium sediminicola]MBB3955524.1 hypothetical protein [Novosphingobium sediminicola]